MYLCGLISSLVCNRVGLVSGSSSKYEDLSSSSSSKSAQFDFLDMAGESRGRNLVWCSTISSVKDALISFN